MTIRRMALGALALACLGGVALAAPKGEDRRLDDDEIIGITAGKTFHYTYMGEPRGEEQHYEDGRVTWILPDGLCLNGVWVVKDATLCYFYGMSRYGCWHVWEDEDGFRHAPVELDGTIDDGPPVYINRISEEPVQCAPQQVASLSSSR